MPNKKGVLTGQERLFVKAYVATSDATYAAEKARYSSPQPRGSQNLAKPAIQAEIRREQAERLTVEGLPLAVDTLFAIMRDPRAAAGARVTAATRVMDRTIGPVTDLEHELHEMTPEQLDRRLQEMWSQRAELAKLVDAKIVEPPKQPASVFD